MLRLVLDEPYHVPIEKFGNRYHIGFGGKPGISLTVDPNLFPMDVDRFGDRVAAVLPIGVDLDRAQRKDECSPPKHVSEVFDLILHPSTAPAEASAVA